jgi:hypothetical protein
VIEPIVAHFPGTQTPLTARQVDLLESLTKHVQAGGNPTLWRQEQLAQVNLVETGDQGVVATCPTCGLVLESEGVECAACWGTECRTPVPWGGSL